MNPEFQRYLWLELSPQRLIVMPVVLAALFVVVAVSGLDWTLALDRAAEYAFIGLTFLWGTRLAAAAVASELRDGTWDAQRMSAQGAFAMSWAKLLGSTVYAWYGALLCLAVFVLALEGVVPSRHVGFARAMEPRLALTVLQAATLALAGLTGQAVALASALAFLRKRRSARNVPVTLCHGLGIIAALAVNHYGYGQGMAGETWRWYGLAMQREAFVVGSALVFCGWALLAVLRLMRIELSYRVRPWAWAAFALYLAVWLVGLLQEGAGGADLAKAPWLAEAFLAVAALIYPAFLLDEKNQVTLAAWMRALARGRLARAAIDAPAWAQLFALSLALGLATVLAPPAESLPIRLLAHVVDPSWLAVLVLAAVLFLLRDLATLLWLNMGKSQRRADGAGLIFLIVFYGLVPPLAGLAGGTAWAAAFVPLYPGQTAASLAGPAVQAALAIVLLVLRTRRTVALRASP